VVVLVVELALALVLEMVAKLDEMWVLVMVKLWDGLEQVRVAKLANH
jgi:hypothetical protein